MKPSIDIKNRKGFSLLDVIIAAAIVGTAMVGVTRAVPIALKAYKSNENQIYASLLYYSAAAYIKGLDFQAVGTPADSDGDFTTDFGLTGVSAGWTWQYTITGISNGDFMARKANITITKGTGYTVTIPSIIFNDIWY